VDGTAVGSQGIPTRWVPRKTCAAKDAASGTGRTAPCYRSNAYTFFPSSRLARTGDNRTSDRNKSWHRPGTPACSSLRHRLSRPFPCIMPWFLRQNCHPSSALVPAAAFIAVARAMPKTSSARTMSLEVRAQDATCRNCHSDFPHRSRNRRRSEQSFANAIWRCLVLRSLRSRWSFFESRQFLSSNERSTGTMPVTLGPATCRSAHPARQSDDRAGALGRPPWRR